MTSPYLNPIPRHLHLVEERVLPPRLLLLRKKRKDEERGVVLGDVRRV
jgi:hypothetical protein